MNISWVSSLKRFFYGSQTTAAIESQPGTGAVLDTRTEEEKQADIHFGEIVSSAAAVVWTTKPSSAWRAFVAFNQGASNACVAFSMAKIIGVMRWLTDGVFVAFAGGDIYRRRSNAPDEGMASTDPYAIAATGVTLDALLPTQNLTDEQITSLIVPEYITEVGSLFALSNPKPVVLPNGDIDAVASVIQKTGKAVMVWFYFTAREWGNRNLSGADFNMPVVLDALASPGDAAALRHSVAAVDFTLYQGQKALVIEDSAWFGGLNRRVVTEDWFRARNFFAAYPMNFKQEKVVDASPKYTFSQPLSFIPWDDGANAPANPALNAAQLANVRALQTVLQTMTGADGKTYFPTNVIPSGYYGALTAQAVYRWGCDHLLGAHISQATLDALAGKLFGNASITEMNKELSV